MKTVLYLGPAELEPAFRRYFVQVHGCGFHSRIKTPPLRDASGWVVDEFRAICASLGNYRGAGSSRLDDVMVVTEIADPAALFLDELDCLDVDLTWGAIVSMLVLTYPEVQWVFWDLLRDRPGSHVTLGTTLGRGHMLRVGPDGLFECLDLFAAGFAADFDFSGLRQLIRRNLSLNADASHVPLRTTLAVSIDDEPDYAWLTAYAAYRQGFRALPISSRRLMNRFLGSRNLDPKITLTFEDLYLAFPDTPASERDLHLSDLQTRTERLPALQNLPFRILLTSGHTHTTDPRLDEKNQDFLDHGSGRPGHHKRLPKPINGLFKIWQEAGLKCEDFVGGDSGKPAYGKRLLKPITGFLRQQAAKELPSSSRPGCAPGYVFPPSGAVDAGTHPHSAPGRLNEVARHLTSRALACLLSGPANVSEALSAAAMALGAQELLGGKTPTAALEALALRQELEVTAECYFYGVSYATNLQPRFEEIRANIKATEPYFSARHRQTAALNAEISVLRDITLRYSALNHFAEEAACSIRSRRLIRRLENRKARVRFVLSFLWLSPLVRWYLEDCLLTSVRRFLACVVGWVAVLWALFAMTDNLPLLQALHDPLHQLSRLPGLISASPFRETLRPTLSAFFSINAAGAHDRWTASPLTAAAGIIGLFHVGVFISHVYARLTRR